MFLSTWGVAIGITEGPPTSGAKERIRGGGVYQVCTNTSLGGVMTPIDSQGWVNLMSSDRMRCQLEQYMQL